ncbi:MAG: T9SS type A sorting domain-containing protein [Bacteroidetes bacterium]|nr:T9SS type A sorting domain-containing protein [Bacteroidota bacterium]
MKPLPFLRLLFFISFFHFCFDTKAQVPEILWEHGYGGNSDDRAQKVIETPDGGFLSVGYSNSTDGDIAITHGLNEFLVIKSDVDGNFEWSKNYGGSNGEYCYGACIGLNGGYVLTGQTNSIDGDINFNHGNYDCWVVKIDSVGNIEWEKTFGGSMDDASFDIIQTSDGNYLLNAGTASHDGDITELHGIDKADFWLVKLNPEGDILWEKTYGSTSDEVSYSIIETRNGDFVAAGFTTGNDGDVSGFHGWFDYWVIRVDSEGNLIWQKALGGSDVDKAYSVVEKSDHGFLIAGETYSDDGMVTGLHGDSDAWVVALDSAGNFQWQKTYGGAYDEAAFSILKYNENLYLFSGACGDASGDIEEYFGGEDGWVVAIDSLGELLWEKNFGGSVYDITHSIILTSTNDLVFTGTAQSIDFDVTETYPFNNFWTVYLDYCAHTFYLDNDGDGFGDLAFDTLVCALPAGFADNALDCDDTNENIYPGAVDICNAIDDNCNGEIDEDATFTLYFADADGDNYGNADVDSLACILPEGFELNNTDCDDTNPDIYPGAEEILNGLDDNCDGFIDEGLALENINNLNITIYPNPTFNILNINYTGAPLDYIIYSVFGNIIYTQTAISKPTQINTTAFAAGIYILQFMNAEGEYYSVAFTKE